MISFSISISHRNFRGIPIGRIYIHHSLVSHSSVISLLPLLHILDEYVYMDGSKRIWFLAPVSLYYRLACQYPNPKFAAYTLYLLRKSTTFFKGLKPPHLHDSDYDD
jgi:hypothetical protein